MTHQFIVLLCDIVLKFFNDYTDRREGYSKYEDENNNKCIFCGLTFRKFIWVKLFNPNLFREWSSLVSVSCDYVDV